MISASTPPDTPSPPTSPPPRSRSPRPVRRDSSEAAGVGAKLRGAAAGGGQERGADGGGGKERGAAGGGGQDSGKLNKPNSHVPPSNIPVPPSNIPAPPYASGNTGTPPTLKNLPQPPHPPSLSPEPPCVGNVLDLGGGAVGSGRASAEEGGNGDGGAKVVVPAAGIPRTPGHTLKLESEDLR